MSDDTNKMNKEKAERIVAAGQGADFAEALNYLREHAPDSAVLRAYDEKVIDGMLEAIRNDRDEREVLGETQNDLSNDSEVAKNLTAITEIYKDEEFQKRVRLTMFSNTANTDVVKDGVVLCKGAKTPEKLEKEEKLRKQVLNEILEAAKHEVLMFYARDKKFASQSEAQKRKILEDGVSEVFNFKLVRVVAASAVQDAKPEDVKNTQAYSQKAIEDMRAALNAFYSGKSVKVKSERVMDTTVRTSYAMDEYEDGLRKQNLSNSASQFNQTKNDYNEKRRSFWGKAFDVAKKTFEGIKKNKSRIFSDAVVVAGAGIGAVYAPVIAAVGMGLYFAVGSYAWLINDERRAQKEKAQDKAAWSWKKASSWTNAWNSIKSDEKKKSKFWRQGNIGAAAGIAGAGLFGVAASTIGIAAGRMISGAARAAGSVANQGANWAVAAKEYKKDATKENKAARDSARTGFYVSAGAAILTNTLAAYLGLNNDAPTDGAEHAGAAGNGSDLTGNPTEQNPDSLPAQPKAEPVVEPVPEPVVPVKVPTEWDASMGISKAHWNEMHEKITGIYEEHSAIFGRENVSSKEAFENMYQNVENARSAGYFEGQTNEEVLYKYMKLIEQTERAEVLKGTKYLVTKLGADGQPMYWVNAEEMKALNDIIICGKKVEIPADNLGKTLALINDQGKYTGEGADIGVTNNHFVGGRGKCGDNQNAWEGGEPARSFADKHHDDIQANANETTLNNIHPAAQTNVSENTIDLVKQPDKQPIAYKVLKYTGGDNTVDSPTGSQPVKVIAQGKGDVRGV